MRPRNKEPWDTYLEKKVKLFGSRGDLRLKVNKYAVNRFILSGVVRTKRYERINELSWPARRRALVRMRPPHASVAHLASTRLACRRNWTDFILEHLF